MIKFRTEFRGAQASHIKEVYVSKCTKKRNEYRYFDTLEQAKNYLVKKYNELISKCESDREYGRQVIWKANKILTAIQGDK